MYCLLHQRRLIYLPLYNFELNSTLLYNSNCSSHLRILSYYSSRRHRSQPRCLFRHRTSFKCSTYKFMPFTKSRLLGGIGTASVLLLTKSKYVVGALKLTKLSTLGSMVLTVGAYTTIYGLPYAVGMVGLILLHESGHALTMKYLNITYSPMVFIPFFGAAIAMQKQPKNVYEEAIIAFGGPILGSLGSFAVFISAYLTDSSLLYALADFGYIINLFNLIPLGMMDGGRICQALTPYAGLIGLGIGGTLFFNGTIQNPIFGVIMIAGGWETIKRLANHYRGISPVNISKHYYNLTTKEQVKITTGYIALVGSLLTAMTINEKFIKGPRQLKWEDNYGNEKKLQNYYID